MSVEARRLLIPGQLRPVFEALRSRTASQARARGMTEEEIPAYVEAISVYLALAVSKCVDYCSTLATWNPHNEGVRGSFPRHAMAMNWDFAEANVLFLMPRFVEAVAETIERLPSVEKPGFVTQRAAQEIDTRLARLTAELDSELST